MEIQKHLFRISEKALKSENAVQCWETSFYVFSALSLLFGLCLAFGHGYVLHHNTDLSRCIKASKIEMDVDQYYYVTDEPLTNLQVETYTKSGKIISNNTECTVIQNKNYEVSDEGRLMFGWDQAGMFMNHDKRALLKYSNLTFSLKQVQNLRKIIFNFDVLIINEILDNPEQIIPFSNKFLMIKSKTAYVFHQAFLYSTLYKIELLVKVIACYIVISIVTSLYIYGTIIAAPAVILLLLKCCRTMRVEGINDIFKLFPWIGIHAIIRETSPIAALKASTSDICKAILYYFIFLYMIYYATIIWIDKRLFVTHIQIGLQEIIFGFIALSEFAAIVFMRTRTFIKYFPSFHSLVIISVLYYAQICDFGFKKLACYFGFSISGALFCWMVINLQIPAHTTWDQTNPNTPKEDRPRIGYFPLFNMSWLKSLPDQWTLMLPLFGRENFTAREMALVDRDNELLNEALGNP